MFLTYRYRLRDRLGADRSALRAQARAVNFVWNYCCEIQREAERRWKAGGRVRWPSYFDLTYLVKGASIELGIHSGTVYALCKRFVVSREINGRRPGWRSGRKNLDWIPIKNASENIRLIGDQLVFRKRRYRLWLSRMLPADAAIKEASFGSDSRGRWYVNLTIETGETRPHGAGDVGVDLGLSHLATLSTGETIPNLRHTARYAAALATANRSRSKRRIRAIHAKIANSRRDHLHKVSTAIMRANRRVVVGNVSASKLSKTKFAKFVRDAGWSTFREMLRYKALRHGVEYQDVDEAWTTRTCSACGCVPTSSPKGMGAIRIRSWKCSECGTVHDRDRNAALNILRIGAERCPPAEGIAA